MTIETTRLSVGSRSTHMHVLGASGRGKSKFLEHLIRQDIAAGRGLCLLDPHGYLYDDLLRWCGTTGFIDRRNVILFEPSSDSWTFGFNPLDLEGQELSFAVDSMVRACAQVWGGEDSSRTPLLKRCLRSVFYALAEKRLTLLEALELTDAAGAGGVRDFLTANLRDFVFQEQWNGFNRLQPREFQEQFSSTNNRLLEFLSARIIRNIIGQTTRTLNLGRVMDEGGILLVNLATRGKISDDNARLLGSLLINDLFLRARGRPAGSRPFYLYIDECAQYVNEDIGRILDEARKFGLHLTLAHQHLAQLRRAGEAVYSAVMTNAQTKVVFGGLAPEDAELMAALVFMGEINFEEAKSGFDAFQVVGHERIWLESESSSESESEGHSYGSTDGRGEQVSNGEGAPIVSSESSGSSTSQSRSTGRTSSRGRSESLRPILERRATAAYSLQEQMMRAAASLVNQPQGYAFLKAPGEHSRQIQVPRIDADPIRLSRAEAAKERVFSRSYFVSPTENIEAEIADRRLQLQLSATRRTPPPEEPESFFE